jgi:hypothetical protein
VRKSFSEALGIATSPFTIDILIPDLASAGTVKKLESLSF